MFKAGAILGFEHDLFVGFPYGLLFSDRRSRYHALSQTRGCHQERRAGFRSTITYPDDRLLFATVCCPGCFATVLESRLASDGRAPHFIKISIPHRGHQGRIRAAKGKRKARESTQSHWLLCAGKWPVKGKVPRAFSRARHASEKTRFTGTSQPVKRLWNFKFYTKGKGQVFLALVCAGSDRLTIATHVYFRLCPLPCRMSRFTGISQAVKCP